MKEDTKHVGAGGTVEGSGPSSPQPGERDSGERKSGGWLIEMARTWGPAILAVLLIRTFVFEPFRIPSGSMVPNLLIGDHVFVTRSSYGLWLPATGVDIPFLDLGWVAPRFEVVDWGDPERGDIIVFRYPQNLAQNYIKRVVAVPGDRIKVQNGQIYLNGELQTQKFVDRYEFVDQTCDGQELKRYREQVGDSTHYTLASPFGGPLRNMGEKVVPPGQVFVMGDNRDNSLDSRSWGFVDEEIIKGKAHFVWLSWDGCDGRFRSERMFQSLYADLP